MKSAASYFRVSTEDQAARVLPIDGQRDAVTRYAAEHSLTIAAEYADPGISGTLGPDRRPGLARLLQDARTGAWATLLVWDDSRLARDDALAGWLRWELRGIPIVAVSSPEASVLEVGIRSLLSAEQVRQIRANTRRGLRARFDRGGRIGSAPFGYRWQDDTMTPEPHELAQVVALFDDAAGGATLTELDRRMDWDRGRTLWTLRNPAYAGGRAYGRKRRTLQRDYTIRWDTHPPAVSRDTWDAVQVRLDGQSWPTTPHEGKLALAGLLRCRCGGRYAIQSWWESARGRAFRWRCRSCGDARTARGWTAAVIAETVRWLTEGELAEAVAIALREAHDAGSNLGASEAQVAQLTGARDRLLDVLTSGAVTDTRALSARLEETQTRLAEAEARLRGARLRSRAAVPDAAEIRSVLEEIAGGAPMADEDYTGRQWLHRTLGAIEVREGAEGRLILSESLWDQRSSFSGGFVRVVRLAA